MWYIIAAILVISLIVVLVKYVLFHPRTNSVVGIICLLWLLISVYIPLNISGFAFLIVFLIPIIDCIRDIIIAPEYYESDLELEIDKLYVIKSLTSLFTLGLARNIFLLVVDPLISASVRRGLKQELHMGRELKGGSSRSILLKARRYHFQKQIKKLVKKGLAVSNGETVKTEREYARKKLEGLYPKKFMDKLIETVAGEQDAKKKRERAEAILRYEYGASYLPTTTYEKIPGLVMEAMSGRGRCPLPEIKYFPELQRLGLVAPDDAKRVCAYLWFDYFIIQALRPHVLEGTFEDNDFNDNDPLDCHAYYYSQSTKAMPSIDADDDPRFALDDD